MVRCAVCNTGRASLHSFPKDPHIRQRWLANIRDHLVSDITPERLEMLLQYDTTPGIWRVCSRHFEQKCFSWTTMRKMMNTTSKTVPNLRINVIAVPTLFTEEEISKKGHLNLLGPAKPPELRTLKPKERSMVSANTIQDVPVNMTVNTALNMPVNTLVSTPVNALVNTPVNTLVSTPVNTPVNTLVSTPVNTQVNAAVNTPVNRLNTLLNTTFPLVSTPVNTPVNAAVNTPVNTALVNTLVNTPVNAAVNTGLVNTPVNALVNMPVNTIVSTQVNTPVNAAVNTLVNTPVNTLVNTPVNTLVSTPVNTQVNAAANTPVNRLNTLLNTTFPLVNRPVNTPVNYPLILTHQIIGQVQVPVVEMSSVKETGKSTPDVPAENLSARVLLHSQLSRWKGACKTLRLTDDQMAKFLLDRYYKGDKSVSAFTGSQNTHKTLLLDRGLVTLWNDSMAAKGFSSDKDFLWFLLLGPQKSGTDSEGCTVRDHGASGECEPEKENYIRHGHAISDNSKDSNDAANYPLTLQALTRKTSPTKKRSVAETLMTTPVPVTSQNVSHADREGKDNEVQKHRRKNRRKQVLEPTIDCPVFPKSKDKYRSRSDNVVSNDAAPTLQKVATAPDPCDSAPPIASTSLCSPWLQGESSRPTKQTENHPEEPSKDDPVLPESLGKVGSRCDYVGRNDTTPTQRKVGGTEIQASTPCAPMQKSLHVERVRKPSNTHSPNGAKRRKYLVLGRSEEPAKDFCNYENTKTCSQPSWDKVDIDLEEDELEIDLNDCDSTTASSQLSSGTVGIRVKQEDDHNHSMSSQLRWDGAVRVKVEKEDSLEMNHCNFDNTNMSCPQLGTNSKEGDKVDYDNRDHTITPPQLSHETVSIKVEKEDGREMDFDYYYGTSDANTSSELSFGTDDIEEEELEMHLNMAILATAEHLG